MLNSRDMLFIRNAPDSAALADTNFWQTEMASRGIVYLSFHRDTFRLLLPAALCPCLAGMRTAFECIVSRGPWPAVGKSDALELLFEDASSSPFCLHFGVEQCGCLPSHDAMPAPVLSCAVYTAPNDIALEMRAYYRRAPSLPYLAWFEK